MPVIIPNFSGIYKVFSNFYPAVVKWKGPSGRLFVFSRVENAYQALKSLNDDHWIPFAMGHYDTNADYVVHNNVAYSAVEAKKKGKLLPLRPDWGEVDIQIMLDLNRQKYKHKALRKILLESNDAIIQEGNYWGDEFWGICNGKCFKGPHEPRGRNFLGLVLMQVRDEINAEENTKKKEVSF